MDQALSGTCPRHVSGTYGNQAYIGMKKVATPLCYSSPQHVDDTCKVGACCMHVTCRQHVLVDDMHVTCNMHMTVIAHILPSKMQITCSTFRIGNSSQELICCIKNNHLIPHSHNAKQPSHRRLGPQIRIPYCGTNK